MNAKYLIAAVVVLTSAGSALAEEWAVPDAGFVSTKTRAEVRAELERARADGSMDYAEYSYPVINFASTKTRDEVRAELAQARAEGLMDQPDYAYPVLQAGTGNKTREQVRAELAEYRAGHPNGDLYDIYVGNR